MTHDQQEAVILADRTALIFGGVLQQFGRPRDFYEKPVSERVARFFGAENFVQGERTQTQIKTPIGVLQMHRGEGPQSSVLVSIRPESIVVGGIGPNAFEATVKDSLYSGTCTRLWLDIAGCEFRAVDAATVTFARGDRVKVAFSPDRLVVLADTEGKVA